MHLPPKSLVTLAATLGASLAGAATPDEELGARMDRVIERAIAEQRIVGTVVVVMRDGQVVYRRAGGFADREAARPMTEDTVLRLASITKPIVSAVVMSLVEQGTLSLEDPVTRWLPDFRPRLADGSQPPITLKQLLTHSAGLSYGFLEAEHGPYRTAGVSDGLAEPGMRLEDNLERIASVPLSYPPGTQWRYSLALDVLGAVLEKASGKSLPALTEERVTGPLDMHDTAFTVKDPARLGAAYRDDRPQPSRMQDETAIRTGDSTTLFSLPRIFDPRSYPSGGAGMAGTADDVARFLDTLRQGGGAILSQASVQAMMTDQVGAQAQTQGPGWGFGYGWAVLDDPALAGTPQSKGTLQWGGVYGHSWFVDPQARLTVVALTNTTFEGMSGAFTQEVRDAAYPAP
ncbi:serine hydrolase domain-containing protein [Pseudomonas chlororaphis]|uniref:Serine hydrolase n=1 Tax=Pseudomonas chlororaphis TaxID=587753 RepID=A0A1Q8EPH1_9PSED|nr:serine hydrolase domain-containing protein [Pseudomonas chlororaphis]OLF53703.1 serine hydrolase [Pseudomonas chlororaphis]